MPPDSLPARRGRIEAPIRSHMATFHPFPRLAYELRAMIWEMTVEPRTVDVKIRYQNRAFQQGPFLTSCTSVPAVLQVCREARSYGLYRKAFSEIASPEKGLQYVWANLETDIINIGESPFREFDPVASKIRRLGFKRELSQEYFYHSEIQDLRAFVNVQDIHIVCADGLFSWLGAFEEHYWPCGEENVYLIDPGDDSRVFRGPSGLDSIAELLEIEAGQ